MIYDIIRIHECNLEKMIEQDAGLNIVALQFNLLIRRYALADDLGIKHEDPLRYITAYNNYYNLKYHEGEK